MCVFTETQVTMEHTATYTLQHRYVDVDTLQYVLNHISYKHVYIFKDEATETHCNTYTATQTHRHRHAATYIEPYQQLRHIFE